MSRTLYAFMKPSLDVRKRQNQHTLTKDTGLCLKKIIGVKP